MKPERWQQISRIFNRAISLDDAARAAYVQEECGKDDDLKAEVERLLESHQKAGGDNFIGGLAVEDAAEQFTDAKETLALQKDQQFGNYFILEHLGSGGMGQVYLAKDSRLDRTVALKILASDVAEDKRRMQRFHQEARVASSLNQPNILTIFEFGEVDSLTFLAAEFIDGQTLRDYMRGKGLKLSEILDIGIQILAALDAAHEARIVHRDVKPENVMVRRRDRVVKVLDFGLSKMTEKSIGRSELSSGEEAVTKFKTAPGLIMGTVNYMSPEQAQGKAVDARSDIWSTGVILYEMVAGTRPFGGTTSAHTIVQILEKVPAPLAHAGAPDVPEELERIVTKSITKDPDERYQTAKDMLIDLRNLKKRLELDAEIQRSSGVAHTASDQPAITAADQTNRTLTTEPAVVRRTNYSVVIALIAIGAAVAGIIGFNVWRGLQQRSVTPVAPAPARTLTYWITVQKFKEGKPHQEPFDLAGEINFEADYQIRLNLRSQHAGYLYVLNEGPAHAGTQPEYVVIFPSPTANDGSEFVAANQRVQIPGQTWLRFDKEQGVEKLWLVFSDQPVSELSGVKAFANAQTRGLITDPQQNKTIDIFLGSYSRETVTPEKSDTLTTLKTSSTTIIYPVRLEHH